MTVKSFALATVLLLVAPLSASAQYRSTSTLVSGPIWWPAPAGMATGATDKHGATKQPLTVGQKPTPQYVPNWKLPLPRIHHRH